MRLNSIIPTYLILLFSLTSLLSCSVKNYPKETPFVFNNKIEIEAKDLNKEEKSILKTNLTTQLVDSLQLRIKQKFIVFNQLMDPAAYDSSYASQSLANMEVFLKTIGYYYGRVNYRIKTDTVFANNPNRKQIRVTTQFYVKTGPVFRVDSLNYFLCDSSEHPVTKGHIALQQLADQNRSGSLLKRGIPFREELILAETDRLISLFRNNGYFKISREQFFADADTVYLPLLNPLLDPFERIEALQEARKRKEHPLINVFFKSRPYFDSSAFKVYRVGTIRIFPDHSGLPSDTLAFEPTIPNQVQIKMKSNQFRHTFIKSHLHLKPGSIYRTQDLNRTLDDMNSLGVWQFIKATPRESTPNPNSDTADIHMDLILVPSKKYAFNIDLESVFNQVQQITTGTAGNLVGIGLNLSIRNRNFDRQGIQSTNTLRGGVEAGVGVINPGLQSTEITYSNSFQIPKLLFIHPGWAQKLNYKKTFINTNISNINRNIKERGLFSLTNINSTFGWQIRTLKNEIVTFQPLNIEYVRLYNISSAFKTQLDTSPLIRYSFTPGLIIGTVLSYSKPQINWRGHPKRSSSFRLGFEESGALFGRLKKVANLFDKELFEYVKLEVEYKYRVSYKKSAWVFRTMVGGGYLYDDSTGMPFFKQFTGGGPNSMRAWPLRSIGQGSRPRESRIGRNQFFSRSGDMVLEANAEYRYNIVTIWPNTLIIRGALFTDIGNIWNFNNKSNKGNDTIVFKFKNLYRDLSVSAGTGIRIDFVGLFLLRFDFGLRLKDPALPFSTENAGWRIPQLSFAHLFRNREIDKQWRYDNFNFSLGINYPF